MGLAFRCRYGSMPRTRQCPLAGVMMPVSILMVVDLPALLAPMYAALGPTGIVKDTPSTARTVRTHGRAG